MLAAAMERRFWIVFAAMQVAIVAGVALALMGSCITGGDGCEREWPLLGGGLGLIALAGLVAAGMIRRERRKVTSK